MTFLIFILRETTTLKASIDQVEVLWFKRTATCYHWNDIIYKCTQNGRKFFSLIETIHEIGLSVLNNCRENMKNRKVKKYLPFNTYIIYVLVLSVSASALYTYT